MGLNSSWTEELLFIPITVKATMRALVNHKMKTLKQVQERPQYSPHSRLLPEHSGWQAKIFMDSVLQI